MDAALDNHQTLRASVLAQDLRALLGKIKRRLREQGQVGDLTPSQVSVLLRLEKDGPATASSLARAEGMRPQSIVPVVAALENAGLVAGAPDPTDGRQTIPVAHRGLPDMGRAGPRGATGLADPGPSRRVYPPKSKTSSWRPSNSLKRLVDD